MKRLACAGLVTFLCCSFPLVAHAQQPGAGGVTSLRSLGGPGRFVAPVRTVDALRQSMSRPNIQRDLATIMERGGLPALTGEVQKILAEGRVTETTMASGTSMEWMALRRSGVGADILRNLRWDGSAPLEGFEFIIDDLNQTYTFFVPEICGNVALVRREPSREAARRAEAARAEEAARAAAAAKAAAEKAAADKAAAEKAAAAKAAAEKAAAEKAAAEKAAADKAAAAAAAAEAARQAEEARKAEEARQAEAARLAAEEADLRFRPFIAGYFGKQQRQYDDDDPAGLGTLSYAVPAFGDQLVGFKGGASIGLNNRFRFVPSIGVGINLDESDRTSLLADAEIHYVFAQGAFLGTGLTFWDLTHGANATTGWIGTAGVPVWQNDARKHQLDFTVEWRQMFDRMSDPDVNYQFWGGLRYLFK
jgi:hypothetical protein